jgi:hypothetical protein
MTTEQEFRMKSLELAILTYGQEGVSFADPKSDWQKIPDELRSRAKAIREYVLKYGAGYTIRELHPPG